MFLPTVERLTILFAQTFKETLHQPCGSQRCQNFLFVLHEIMDHEFLIVRLLLECNQEDYDSNDLDLQFAFVCTNQINNITSHDSGDKFFFQIFSATGRRIANIE